MTSCGNCYIELF